MKKSLAINLSAIKELKTPHYKIILYLDEVGAATQSKYKIILALQSKGLA